MRLSTPRIPPVDMEHLTSEQAVLLDQRGGFAGEDRPLKVLRTIAQAPRALKRYLLWSDYLLGPHSDLSVRLRELAILRTGWLCRSGYEWAQHVTVARQAGLSDDEIARVKLGPGALDWPPLERAVLNAVDELFSDHFITDSTWQALSDLGDKGRMDLVFTCGQYVMVAMLLNSLGVQLESGQELEPELKCPIT